MLAHQITVSKRCILTFWSCYLAVPVRRYQSNQFTPEKPKNHGSCSMLYPFSPCQVIKVMLRTQTWLITLKLIDQFNCTVSKKIIMIRVAFITRKNCKSPGYGVKRKWDFHEFKPSERLFVMKTNVIPHFVKIEDELRRWIIRYIFKNWEFRNESLVAKKIMNHIEFDLR